MILFIEGHRPPRFPRRDRRALDQVELADALSVRMAAKLDTTPGMEKRVAEILREFLLKNPEYIEMLEPILEA